MSVAVLAGVHPFAPYGRPTRIGLAVACLMGSLIGGFLLLGFLIPGGTPDEYEALARVSTPLLGLYAASIVALVVKVRTDHDEPVLC